MQKMLINVVKITFIPLFGLLIYHPTTLHASDHVDGPITINHPVADISDLYAFPSPQKPGHLVLILNSYPFVPGSGHFSDSLVYSLAIKPVTIMGTGVNSGFKLSNTEYRFDCTFETPDDKTRHSISCITPTGKKIQSQVNNETGAEASGVHLFAGRRSDPFLFNASWIDEVIFNRTIPAATASNDLSGLNVLSIVMELDPGQFIKPEDGHLFSIVGEIRHRHTEKNTAKRIDRVGRPEISNACMCAEAQQDDLRNTYNQTAPFYLDESKKQQYLNRLIKNIRYYDSLDDTQDWLPQWQQTLANLLLNDYLVIDMNKPFTTQGYFDIEYSMLRNQQNTRSGGRIPGENIINTLMTMMVNAGHGSPVVNGINSNSDIQYKKFPYLNPPASGIFSAIKGYFARKAAAKISLQKRPAY